MEWEAVIGLEVHTQLATASKIFSGAATAYGAEPNTQACPVDLGLPGVLPVLNERALEFAVRFGLAIDATITRRSVFARKNYFYPDLPKGYQISQYEAPIVAGGHLDIDVGGTPKTIRLTRAHLEEDAGKSLHEDFHGLSGIDLNRAGTPLLEIVSEPDMRTAAEAVAYLRTLHRLVRYLEICDGNMQEGSFRCDANVSVRPRGSDKLGTRTEIKNLNSFRFVERAIEHEIARQIDVIEGGGSIRQETRLYDSDRDETRPMRSKEDAHDYRYFPDPDLLPVVVKEDYIAAIRARLPELPTAKFARYTAQYGLSADDATTLLHDPDSAAWFEHALAQASSEPKVIAHWVTGELFGALNRESLAIADSPVSPTDLAQLVARIQDGTLSGKMGKEVFQALWAREGTVDGIIEARGLKQVSDTGLIDRVVAEILAAHPEQVEQLRAGKDKVLGFLVGQVMKQMKGQANPGMVNDAIRRHLG